MIVSQKLRFILFLSTLTIAGNAFAASITGGGETVETTPTPKPGFKESQNTPSETPKPTPEDSDVLPPVPAGTPSKTIDFSPENATPTPTPTPRNDFRIYLKQAQKSFREKDFDNALEMVRKAETLKPDQPDIINFRGAIYAETGRYAEAVALYEKALTLQPDSFWPAFNIAELDFIQQKYADARTKLQALQVKNPKNELLPFKIVLTYLLEKNDSAAKKELEKFPFPEDTAAREFAMAAWEFAHKNPEKADEWIKSGVYIFGYGRTDFLYQSLADLKWVPTPRPLPAKAPTPTPTPTPQPKK